MPKLNNGRKRELHPEFFTDERVLQVEPAARLLFQGLWTLVDRQGRMEEPHPLTLKARFLPVDNVDCADLMSQLDRVGLVRRYRVDGRALLWLPGFRRRNHPHPKEIDSGLPPHPFDATAQKSSKTAMEGPLDLTQEAMEGGSAGRDLSGSIGIHRDLRDPSDAGGGKVEPNQVSMAVLDALPPTSPEAPAPEAEAPAEPAEPAQKPVSAEVLVYEAIQAERRACFERLELPFVPDREPNYARVTVTVQNIARRTGRGPVSAFELYQVLLRDPWWAEQSPPWPFSALGSDKVVAKLWATYQREESESEAA